MVAHSYSFSRLHRNISPLSMGLICCVVCGESLSCETTCEEEETHELRREVNWTLPWVKPKPVTLTEDWNLQHTTNKDHYYIINVHRRFSVWRCFYSSTSEQLNWRIQHNPMQKKGWRKPLSNTRLLCLLISKSKQQYERWKGAAAWPGLSPFV